jgi:histidinol-phosphate aminotransferase
MAEPSGPGDLLRPEVLSAARYQVPDAAGLVKLDAMENPHGLPPELRREWADLLAELPVNRYPDAGAAELKRALRAFYRIPDGCELLLGNGSDEIIQVLALACARPGAGVLAFEPSFVMYAHCARLCGMRYTGIPLRQDFSLPIAEVLPALDELRPALTFVAQPNNPTGSLCDAAPLAQFAAACPGLLVIDEAYHAFSGADSMPLLAGHRNVLVLRTLSKLGLAGLRIGFLVGRPEWIAELEKVRMPYNIGTLAQAGAVFLLRHRAHLDAQAAQIRNDRDRLRSALARIPGIEQWPSAANFILFRALRCPGRELHARIRARGVLIRNLDGAHPLLRDCLRVTVGTPAENDMFIEALRASLTGA